MSSWGWLARVPAMQPAHRREDSAAAWLSARSGQSWPAPSWTSHLVCPGEEHSRGVATSRLLQARALLERHNRLHGRSELRGESVGQDHPLVLSHHSRCWPPRVQLRCRVNLLRDHTRAWCTSRHSDDRWPPHALLPLSMLTGRTWAAATPGATGEAEAVWRMRCAFASGSTPHQYMHRTPQR